MLAVLPGDPRTVPIDGIVADRVPRAWILAGRPLHQPLVERLAEFAPANVVVEGRAAESELDLAAIERALDGAKDLEGHLALYPALVVVSEPQWLDQRSLEQISRLSESDTPVVVIASRPSPDLSGLRDTLVPEDRRFTEPWIEDEGVESWVTSRLGRHLGDTALSELLAASAGSAHLLNLLIMESARRDMRMPGGADTVPAHPGETILEFKRRAFEDLDLPTAAQVELAATASIPVASEHRHATFAVGLTDLRGIVHPALAAAISVSLDDVGRRDLAHHVTKAWKAGALSAQETTKAFLEIGRADLPAAEAVVSAASSWVSREPARSVSKAAEDTGKAVENFFGW